MEDSKTKDFIDTYCSIPPAHEPEPIIMITEKQIIDNFMSHIENTCVDTHNVVKYKMPIEFYGKIDKKKFWEIVITFISRTMNFEDYNLGEWKPEQIYDTSYDWLDYRVYFLVWERKYDKNDEYSVDHIAVDIHNIDKIVFRIYKK
jgi:hypothetical protein